MIRLLRLQIYTIYEFYIRSMVDENKTDEVYANKPKDIAASPSTEKNVGKDQMHLGKGQECKLYTNLLYSLLITPRLCL